MLATITPVLWNNYENPILEGGLYKIVNVRVREAFGFYRPVSTAKCINFVTSTIVSPILHDDFIIPMHKFEVKHLEDLHDILRTYEPYQKPIHSTGDSNFK